MCLAPPSEAKRLATRCQQPLGRLSRRIIVTIVIIEIATTAILVVIEIVAIIEIRVIIEIVVLIARIGIIVILVITVKDVAPFRVALCAALHIEYDLGAGHRFLTAYELSRVVLRTRGRFSKQWA